MRSWIDRFRFLTPGRRHSLVTEILVLQLLFAAYIGVIAVATLWWGANWAVTHNVTRWSREWVGNLGQLGAPLYASADDRALLVIEDYLAQFPEIMFVRYYDGAAGVLFSEAAGGFDAGEFPDLDAHQLEELTAQFEAGETEAVLNQRFGESRFRLVAPVIVSTVLRDGMVDFDLADEAQTAAEIRGFVELGLDFSRYRRQLVVGISSAIGITVLALIVLSILASSRLRSSLKPLSELRNRLADMAGGSAARPAEPSGFVEIDDINRALDRSVAAIDRRDKRLKRMAHYDVLTGLPNRYLLLEKIESEVQRLAAGGAEPAALLLIDLDHFSYVTDTASHAAGDRILKQVAERLHTIVGREQFLARFEGDEFVAILRGIDGDAARDTARRVVEQVPARPFIDSNRYFTLHVSVGAIRIDPAQRADELLAQAGLACHEAKRSGRNRYRFLSVSGQAQEQIAVEMDWLEAVKAALDNDDFQLVFEPIVATADGGLTHHEVLLRLIGKGGELIAPGEFLGVASRFGLMRRIDRWVLRHALSQLAARVLCGHATAFSINLSGDSFSDQELVGFVTEKLAEFQLSPELVMLEITEQVAVTELAAARDTLNQLRELGIRIALDDFGTGYSSLTYLKSLPVDYIKIDGAFIENLVNDPADQAMVRAIAEIARATDKRTIAEYVGNRETLELLRSLGIDSAQGHYIGRSQPTPSMAFDASPETA